MSRGAAEGFERNRFERVGIFSRPNGTICREANILMVHPIEYLNLLPVFCADCQKFDFGDVFLAN